jgi:O-antigen/teichoic acid export membrane protein
MSAPEDRPRSPVPRKPGRGAASRDSGVLAVGSAIGGLLAYVFFALATRSLGAERAAPVSVLWSFWAVAAAVLTFAVQHWTIRTLARDGHEGTVARSVPRISAVSVGLSALAGVGAFAFRHPLFHQDGVVFPTLIAAVTAGSFFVGLVRGALAGRGRYVATAASLIGENAIRVVAAAGVAFAGGGAKAFGVALVVGPLIGLVWARSLRFDSSSPASSDLRSPLALVSGIAGGSLIAQIVLTSAPVVLAAIGGAQAEVTSLFVALAVWRAPYLLALGMSPRLTPALTLLVVDGQLRRLTRVRRMTVLGVVVGAAAAALVGLTLMQPVLHVAFGPDVNVNARALAALGVGTATALGNLVLLLMLLAFGRSRAATTSWAAALAVSVGWTVLSTMAPEPRVVVAFLLAQLTAFALLLAACRPRAGLGPTPISADSPATPDAFA